MPGFDRVLIALELGDEDEATLAYANHFLRSTAPRRLDVVHVLDTRMVPDAMIAKYGDWFRPALKRREERLEGRVATTLELPAETNVQRHVLVGAPHANILELCQRQQSTLIVTGRNRRGSRVATLPARLARSAACSVLVVPEGSRPALQNILVAIDFSADAAHAVRVAAALADATLGKRLRGLHAYALPPGARHSGQSERELVQLVRIYAERAHDRFSDNLGALPVPLEMEFALDLYPAHAVLEAAREGRCDLVVVGGRQRSANGHAPLGRVAARVLHESPVPVLITRQKGDRREPHL